MGVSTWHRDKGGGRQDGVGRGYGGGGCSKIHIKLQGHNVLNTTILLGIMSQTKIGYKTLKY